MDHRVLQQCRAASSGLSLLPPSHPVPNFYLYPSPFDHEKLMACFERTKHKPWNVTADTGAWMYHALEKHPARVPTSRSMRLLGALLRGEGWGAAMAKSDDERSMAEESAVTDTDGAADDYSSSNEE